VGAVSRTDTSTNEVHHPLTPQNHLPREVEHGSVEYKQRLVTTSPWRLEQLTTQMQWRLTEGGGACTYLLGVADDGNPVGLPPATLAASLETLSRLAASLGCTCRVASQHAGNGGRGHLWATVIVSRPSVGSGVAGAAGTPVRVCLGGAPGAGKSTLLALLLRGGSCTSLDALDDGCGGARAGVAAHKHELVTGRTSALRHHCLAFDSRGRPFCVDGSPEAGDVAQRASSLATLCELPSGEYGKTALFGLSCMHPHAMLLCIPAGCHVSPHAAQHLAAALALGVPVAGVVTHTDAAGVTVEQWAQPLRKVLRAAHLAALPEGADVPDDEHLAPMVRDARHATSCAAMMVSGCTPLCPLLSVSCVTGTGMATVHAFLAALRRPVGGGHLGGGGHGEFVFLVETLLSNPEAGTLAAGVAVGGTTAPGDTLWLGPVPPCTEDCSSGSTTTSGPFLRVQLRTLHIAHCPVDTLSAGQAASMALQGASAGDHEALARLAGAPRKKGLVLLRTPAQVPPTTCSCIHARLVGVVPGWSAASLVVHCGSIRAQVRLETLSPGAVEEQPAAMQRLMRRAAACTAVLATCGGDAVGVSDVTCARLVFTQGLQYVPTGAPLLLCDASTAGVLAVGEAAGASPQVAATDSVTHSE
jgi:GTPase